MFHSKEDLLQFLLQCRQAKIKAIKVGDVQVEFSELAFLDTEGTDSPKVAEERSTSQTMVDTSQDEVDEELLFWSSKA